MRQFTVPIDQRSPTFMATGTGFVEDNFSLDGVGGLVSAWVKYITLIVHFISIIITSAPLQIVRPFRSQSLGIPADYWYVLSCPSAYLVKPSGVMGIPQPQRKGFWLCSGHNLLRKSSTPHESSVDMTLGKTDAEAGTPVLWPPDAKSCLIGKHPDAGKDWRQEEKGTTEDEMVGWHHQLKAHAFEQAPGAGEGQGSLACCGPWGRKEPNMTEQLNWPTRGDIRRTQEAQVCPVLN